MLITEILERNARMYGSEVALVERDPGNNSRKEMSWAEFDAVANRIANTLIKNGVAKGDKVVLLLMNCLEWLPIYFGIVKTGAWVVPLNFRFPSEDIQYCTEIAGAELLFFGEEFIERIDSVKHRLDHTISKYIFVGTVEKCPEYAQSMNTFIGSADAHPPDVEIHDADSAALYFTSGTTGNPKAVHLTHRNLEFSCYVENRHHNQTHSDIFLCIPPLYHTGAKMHWFGSFIVGGKGIILKGAKPKQIIEAISEEKASIVWLLVPWAHDILIAIENNEIDITDYDLSQWRLMHMGAQPIPPSLIRKWHAVFPHHAYDTNYGLTESTGPGCVHLGLDNTHKVGAIGVPGFDWETMIVDWDEWTARKILKPAAQGQSGELAVRGPGVMKEYYKNPDATATTLVDGWLLTGDIARTDEHGFIWLVDRAKDIIITGGENIFPVEIESFIMDNDKVQDVAVIGAPDERLGEIVTAVIQAKPNQSITEDEITAFCEKLPRYKRPRKIIFDDIPRNPTGKIEKPKLRKKYTGFTQKFKI